MGIKKPALVFLLCCIAASLPTFVCATTMTLQKYNEAQIKPKQIPLKPTTTSKPMEPGVLLCFGVGLLVLPAFRRLNRHSNLKL